MTDPVIINALNVNGNTIMLVYETDDPTLKKTDVSCIQSKDGILRFRARDYYNDSGPHSRLTVGSIKMDSGQVKVTIKHDGTLTPSSFT